LQNDIGGRHVDDQLEFLHHLDLGAVQPGPNGDHVRIRKRYPERERSRLEAAAVRHDSNRMHLERPRRLRHQRVSEGDRSAHLPGRRGRDLRNERERFARRAIGELAEEIHVLRGLRLADPAHLDHEPEGLTQLKVSGLDVGTHGGFLGREGARIEHRECSRCQQPDSQQSFRPRFLFRSTHPTNPSWASAPGPGRSSG